MKRLLVLAFVALLGLVPTLASDGPWLVVASPNDQLVTAVDLSSGEVVGQEQIGQLPVGVAAVGRRVAISDFYGGALKVFSGQEQGDFIGIRKDTIDTRPGLTNPEGITPTGDGAWALVTDGGKRAPGPDVSLVLADLASGEKVSEMPFPSVYGVAWDPAKRVAWVLDGFEMMLRGVYLWPDGTFEDTGIAIPLTGTAYGVRYVALYAMGTRALVSHKMDGKVEVLDLAEGKSLGFVEIGGTPGAIAVTPDGSKALVADYTGSQWVVLDLAGDMPVDTGIRVASPFGVPNTYVGTKTFCFEGPLMFFSATDGAVVTALDWTSLEMTGLAFPAGVSPAGLTVVH